MHTKLNYTQAAALFESIATKHKEINSFVETELEDPKEVIKSGANLPAMLFAGFSEKMSAVKDNNQSGKRFYFWIVDSYSSKRRNPKSKHELIDACRLLAIDVISYLRNEKRNNRLNGFDPESISDGKEITDMGDGFYGWGFSLVISTPIDLSFKPEKWNE